jgi:peptide/nickel transport system substrate-binding protein
LRFYPDQPTALNALQDRQIQGLLVRPVLDGETLELLRPNNRWRLYSGTRPSYTALFLNLTLPIFQDKTVRQALLYGLDRENIVGQTLVGQGFVASSPIPVGSWAHDRASRPTPYDAAQPASCWMRQDGLWEITA